MRVHVIQVAYDDREPVAERTSRVAEMVRDQRGADLVVLPELWAHGGFAAESWAGRAEGLDGSTISAVAAAARSIGAVVHAGSIIESGTGGPEGRNLWNTSVLLDTTGGIIATYRKIHRFGFGAGEPEILECGEEIVTRRVGLGMAGPWNVGLATCYDLRFPEMFRRLLGEGAELFLVPAAWPAPRVEHWTLLGRARAIENQSFVIQCNTAGTHSGLTMGGHSQVVSPLGEVLASAGGSEEILRVEIDHATLRAYREDFPALGDRRILI